MKKRAIVTLLTLAMLFSGLSLTGVFAEAATFDSPWSNSDYKVNVYDDLSYLNTDREIVAADIASTAGTPTVTMEAKNGAIVVTSKISGWWNVTFNFGNTLSDTTGVEGIGYYFENNGTTGTMLLMPMFVGDQYDARPKIAGAGNTGMPMILVDSTTGTETLYNTVAANRYFTVPAGFKGHIMMPLTSLENVVKNGPALVAGAHSAESPKFNLNAISFRMNGAFEKGKGNVVYDNFFVYGKTITDNKRDLLGIPEKQVDKFVPVMRFGVFGDAHFLAADDVVEQRFEKAMDVLYSLGDVSTYKNVDAVLFPGDFVQFGSVAALDVFKGALDEYVKDGTEVIATIGNHEQMENGSDMNYYSVAVERLKNIGLEVRQHIEINGYHFIDSPLVWSSAGWNDTQHLDWVETELAAAAEADPDKPIFVTRHIPFKNTVIGDNQYFDNLNFGKDEYELYAEYPQILSFVAHTHHVFNVPNAIHQRDFTSVVSGNLRSGIDGSASGAPAEFLICEVDAENTVRLRPYDVSNDRFVGEPWLIENPSDKEGFSYTDDRAESSDIPEFKAGAEIKVDTVTTTGASVTFPQAACEDVVYRYRVQVFKGDIKVQDYYVSAKYWAPDVPDEITASIANLGASAQFKVVVTPENSYFKSGTTSLEKTFTTNKNPDSPWTNGDYKVNVYDDLSTVANKTFTTEDGIAWSSGLNDGITIEGKNGTLAVTSNTTGSWFEVRFGFGKSLTDTTGVEGMGFYFENTLSKSVYIIPTFVGADTAKCLAQTAFGAPVMLIDSEGKQAIISSVATNRYFTVPAGFKGHIAIPLSSLENVNGRVPLVTGKYTEGSSIFNIAALGIKAYGSFEKGSGSLVFDNYFAYGTEIADNDRTLLGITGSGGEEKPSPDRNPFAPDFDYELETIFDEFTEENLGSKIVNSGGQFTLSGGKLVIDGLFSENIGNDTFGKFSIKTGNVLEDSMAFGIRLSCWTSATYISYFLFVETYNQTDGYRTFALPANSSLYQSNYSSGELLVDSNYTLVNEWGYYRTPKNFVGYVLLNTADFVALPGFNLSEVVAVGLCSDWGNLDAGTGTVMIESFVKIIDPDYVPTYNITYVLDGGTNAAGNPSTYTPETGKITLAAPTRSGYKFLGWYNGEEKITEIAAGATGDLTLEARWEAIPTYNITYVLGGGTNAAGNPSTYTAETGKITLAAPTRDGYKFLGWYNGEEKVTEIAAGSTGDLTLEARWEEEAVVTPPGDNDNGCKSAVTALTAALAVCVFFKKKRTYLNP